VSEASCDLELGCGCGPAEPFDVGRWWRVGVGLLIAANAMTISLALHASEVTAGERRGVNTALGALALISLLLLGWPLARGAWLALRRRRVAMEGLFLIGVAGAFTGSVLGAVTGVGETYFETVCILLAVYAFGQQLAAGAERKALRAALEWAPGQTECTVLGEYDEPRRIAVAELRAGQVVVVEPGETIAADGVVVAGEAFVREAEMTGELQAAVRRVGDLVWAGTHAVDALLRVRATADGGDRRIDHIVDAVERARTVPSSLQSQADRAVSWLLPAAVTIAVAAGLAWNAAAGWRVGLFNAMAVLLVACPCAFGLATPLAVWTAVGRLAARGLVLRGGDGLERLARVDTVVFDKTGTLTEPRAGLLDVVVAAADPEEVRAMVAAVERAGRHPVAAALAGIAEPGLLRIEGLRVLPATGVEAWVVRGDGGAPVRVTIGAADRLDVDDTPQWRELSARLRPAPWARQVVALADGLPVLAATVDERLRSSWPESLARLRALGLGTLVLTGDRAERAAATGADRVLSGLTPEAKVAEVNQRRAGGGTLLYVGDGVNDAAAMAASDVSIGVASGAELAAEVADATWFGDDLRVLPWALELARTAVHGIRSNLWIAAGYNLVGVGLAVAGLLHPVTASLLMTCSSLVVTWRATAGLQAEQDEAERAALATAVASEGAAA